MGESGEVTLQDAIERLEAGSVRTRAEGLADLSYILRHGHQTYRTGTLADASYHRIFEILFGLAIADKAVSTNGKTPALRSGGTNRLSACASALRLAVDVSVPVLRLKTVRAVLDHVDQTLEISSGRLCEPLAFDYAKCMRSIFAYPPHVEHLSKDRWERATKFCLDIIKSVEKSEHTEDSVSDMESGTPNGTSYRSTLSRTGGVSRPQKPRSLARQVAGEMIVCLKLLTAAPNAPLVGMASSLLWALIDYLKSNYTSNRSHQDSFAASLATINNVLSWTHTENISLTKQATNHLIRVIRTHWTAMMNSVKDEMILTIHHLQPYLLCLMGQGSQLSLRPELSGLLEVMQSDYSKRQDRDRLQMDEIRLDLHTVMRTDPGAVRCGSLSLKPTRQNLEDITKVGARGEHNWFIVSSIAFITRLLDSDTSDKDSDEEEMDARPRKRQRTVSVLDDLHEACTDSDARAKTTALQTVAFLVPQIPLSAGQLKKILQRLVVGCGDDNGSVASWALLAVANCATQRCSSDESLSAQWSNIWQITCRSITNATTSRAASHLLHVMLRLRLVSQALLSELFQSFTVSMELSGPALICDAAIQLLCAMGEHVASVNPGSALALADNTLSWLLRRWTPSAFEDRSYAATCKLYDVPDFVEILADHLRQSTRARNVKGFPVWHTVARGFLRVQGQRRVVSYLLTLPEEVAHVHPDLISQISRAGSGNQTKPRLASETLILNHIAGELGRMIDTWEQTLRERQNTVSDEVFRSLCFSVAVGVSLVHTLQFRDARKHKDLKDQCRRLLRSINEYVSTQSCQQDKVDGMLACFASAFWVPKSCASDSHVEADVSECEKIFCAAITDTMTSRRVAQDTNSIADYDDAMDLDQSYGSQESRRAPEAIAFTDLVDNISTTCSISALRAAIPLYASIQTTLATNYDADTEADRPSSTVVDIILDFSQHSILASSSILGRLTELMPDFGVEDADRLLEHLTQTMLTAYPFERSEVAIGTVLETMINLKSLWTNASNGSLYSLGIDTYNWCASTALKGGVLSPNAQSKVANLLLQISQVDGEYGRADDVPSVWSSLFQLLKSGAITAQFYLAEHISTLFGRYTLQRHGDLFNDLQESLPAELEKIEGMAIRMLFFARLAASWHTLRRQCVYYIFETAGSAETALPFASICVRDVASSLGFSTPQKLFRLFAPQLLHTWLEGHQLDSLPYSAFGYSSLSEVLEQNEVEVTAQIFMRGLDSGVQLMMDTLKATEKQLIERAAWKSEAYALGWEISQRAAKVDVKVEERLRKYIGGKEQMERLCVQHFPAIMGQFYLSLNQDDVEDSWLEKASEFSYAAKALAEIKSYGYSSRALPTPQQPSFRGRLFPEQVSKLCRRSGKAVSSQWEESSLALTVRMLLDSVDESLGSSHACSVLRKLRLLVATAGDVAFSGYPLELLIRSVQPYLMDAECADDALGILQYLLFRGQKHFSRDTSFLCGAITLTSLRMQKHMGAQHDNTTQETQHKETVDRMKRLQSWIVQYLQHLRQQVDARFHEEYSTLVGALTNMHLPGNSRKDSPEATLILLLVRQLDARIPLFQARDVHEALMLLAVDFEAALSPSEDILADDSLCVRYAPHLWRVCANSSVSRKFLLWAANTAGKAYAATGSRQLFSASGASESERVIAQLSGIQMSEALILRKISDILSSSAREETGLAEYTLRAISDNYARWTQNDSAAKFEQVLPSNVSSAVKSGTHGYVTPGVPQISASLITRTDLQTALAVDNRTSLQEWATEIAVLLSRTMKHSILAALPIMLHSMQDIAVQLLPSIVHMVLIADTSRQPVLRPLLSACMAEHLAAEGDSYVAKQKYLLELLLYLRQKPYPGEATLIDRANWLDCDYMLAARTAAKCGMPTFALMLAESIATPVQPNRRASGRASLSQALVPVEIPGDLQISIFEQVDEPDSFYGVEQPASLDTVLARLDYENNGFKSLMFRSAQVDNHMRQSNRLDHVDALGMIRSLSSLNLNSLTFALTSGGLGVGAEAADDMLSSARELQQWDVAIPQSAHNVSSRLMKVYQDLNHVSKRLDARASLESMIVQHASATKGGTSLQTQSHGWCNTLGVLSELLELVSGSSGAEISAIWQKMKVRQSWMDLARFEDFDILQQSRQIALSVLAQNSTLLEEFQVQQKDVRVWQAQALLTSSALARKHGQLQKALAAATQVNDLTVQIQYLGLTTDAAAKHEVASTLWAADERTASVSMLREVLLTTNMEDQAIPVGRAGLLAQLGHQLAEARLEKPNDILDNYLKPAVDHLPKGAKGTEAGAVYHTFAAFCDQQLQHPSNVEDYNRITTIRQRKFDEVRELEALVKSSRKGAEKKEYEGAVNLAKKWFKLDDDEYKKQKQTREAFILQSLQNYLLALRASDEHDICVLRFFALWLENAESPSANDSVAKLLPGVPSWKFVVLMNQIMSRLKNDGSKFQEALKALTVRMCRDHPYHGVHHLYASTNSAAQTASQKDHNSSLRYGAATSIRGQLMNANKDLFTRLFQADGGYKVLAGHKLEDQHKRTGTRPRKDIQAAETVATKIPDLRVPPATINLPLRPDCDYSKVPYIIRFGDKVQIMSGLSTPKVLTAIASDGRQYRQLFKSGNDDLRQDAIMEQVFEEVSKMLQKHKATRQRNLHIRTYKVVPMTARSGIIEFVPNSAPINDILLPAHEKYYPGDWKNSKARDTVRSAQDLSTDSRVKEFRKVCEHLHPVLRHFFTERFSDPDEWFERRTAYTRTTASVSMLGHVLGLGDRHCHNIMIDEKNGEVIHIDLGVAFEAGRILPVPELVPFRLTRDIIDGFGVTKTEGVFRRCCEFTMDALRSDKDSIMTLLNVLRYDPLYTWTLSPLRAKRMQAAQETGQQNVESAGEEPSAKKDGGEAGEADRALNVVEKKLSKSLSTAATVNELIQQATDERHLATLFAGWTAWY